jgi:hypothetical protein
MSDGFREEIRVFLDDPGRARAEFQARSAEFARLTSSAAWWMDRWADRAGKDAAHIPHATAHFPAMRTTPTSRRTTAAQPSPGCAATYDWQARHQELKMKPMTTPMGGRAIGSERPRLYSFGHSNVALEDFLCLLKSRRIESLLMYAARHDLAMSHTSMHHGFREHSRNRRSNTSRSEEDPLKCHRHLLIGRVLRDRGVAVLHIRGDGRIQAEDDLDCASADASPQGELFEANLEDHRWRSAQSVSRRRAPLNSSEH